MKPQYSKLCDSDWQSYQRYLHSVNVSNLLESGCVLSYDNGDSVVGDSVGFSNRLVCAARAIGRCAQEKVDGLAAVGEASIASVVAGAGSSALLEVRSRGSGGCVGVVGSGVDLCADSGGACDSGGGVAGVSAQHSKVIDGLVEGLSRVVDVGVVGGSANSGGDSNILCDEVSPKCFDRSVGGASCDCVHSGESCSGTCESAATEDSVPRSSDDSSGGYRPPVVSSEFGDDGLSASQVGVATPKPGRWASSNKRKREKKKEEARRLGVKVDSVPVWRRSAGPLSGGFCETVVSQPEVSPCPSYGQALSDAEKEAKESLARRRAAENAVAQKLAELRLASLSDEKRCEQINDLKRQRLVEWTQVSAAKTQESLERLKAAGGIVVTDEQHAKVLRRVKDLEYEYDVLKERVKRAGQDDLLVDLKAPGTATEAYEQAQAEMWAYGSVHSEPTGSDAAKIKERLEEFDRVYLETGQPPPFRPLDEDDDRPRDPVADIMRYRNRDNYGGPEFKW